MPSIGAIILAAGGGSRMGRTKQLLRLGGQSLVRRAARAALDAGCRPAVVVIGSDSDAVAADIADLPVQSALNPRWSAGIGTSIRCGLSAVLAIDPSIAAVIVALCDQPRLSPRFFAIWLPAGPRRASRWPPADTPARLARPVALPARCSTNYLVWPMPTAPSDCS